MQKAPLARGLAILKFVAETGAPVGFQDVADGLGLNITTARRLLLDLASTGMLVHDPELKTFSLGVEFLRICSVALSGRSVMGLVRPAVEELVDDLGETCCLYILDRTDMKNVLMLVVRSGNALDYELPIGVRADLFAGSGKVVLAHLGDAEMREALAGGLRPITGNTITDRDELSSALAAIRKDGYGISFGERVEGAVGVAAPIFDRSGVVVGTLVLTIPEVRIDRAALPDIATEVVGAAQEISSTLATESFSFGWRPDEASAS